jgi:GR25 family glycosyltransferase involved in LPS biosynthesis
MRVGIAVFFQHSFFSNGLATAAFSLAKAVTDLGHKVVLVNTNGATEWFEDCQGGGLKERYERVHLTQWQKGSTKFDIFIDMDGYLNPQTRREVGDKVIVFIRKPVALGECEHTVYPIAGPVRNLRDCDAVWTWDHLGAQDAHILEVLSEKPVTRLPYTWSSEAVEAHTIGHPTWVATAKDVANWTCHITETNQSTVSNSTLPIVIMGYTKTHTDVPLGSTYIVHNAQQINEQQFFKDNVLAHCKRDGLEAQIIGRQRISDWRLHGKSFVLAHNRFVAVKGALLDCVWNGIPLVHNSPWLRDAGCGYYYADNSVKGAAAAIKQMAADYAAGAGMFVPGALERTRSSLAAKLDVRGSAAWVSAFGGVEQVKVAPAEPTPKTELVVGFSDLWADANTDYNFWTLLLQEACSKLRNPVKVRGIQITYANSSTQMDVLFFGPFGDTWTRVPAAVPKVHITGENTASRFGPGVYLNLGFDETDKSKGIYRFPLWTQYIDWFGADQERLVNPKSMPIDKVARVDIAGLRKKSKFCAFIVSNPSNSVRNDAFHALNSYHRVDSAGRLFNNIGDSIFTGTAGGGGGELKKLEFLRDYKFCITYENSRRDGYITEKFLAAKAAGCVPIYWGDMTPTRDFLPGSYIDANRLEGQSLIDAVRKMNEDDASWLAAASIPAIQVDKERKRLAEVAKLILEPLVGSAQIQTIPNMLGAASTAEAAALRATREGVSIITKALDKHEWNGKVLLTTFATEKYLPSLVHWLASAEAFMKQSTVISIRVYLGNDVGETQINGLRSEYPGVTFMRLGQVTVEGFPDLWEPQHFAWKNWICDSLVREAALQNTLVWYMDCASIIVRWPEAWLIETAKAGICMLEDKEQYNREWCHEEFCKALSVIEAEKDAHQIWAGSMMFVCGAPLAWAVFEEGWKWAQKRDVIVGPKWAGINQRGKPYGHRHDQSILSILQLRHKVPLLPLETVYNHDSLRRTKQAGSSLYVHRGQIKLNDDFAPGIGDVHLVNLARRKDRLERFKANHESWTKRVCLKPAIDGRSLTLTPALARLFMPNDFMWKKAIMGCALSHLSLWINLANEHPSCENYLILEDDVKFHPDWLSVWEEASKHIPEDYDVLYLGGILPPNRSMFEKVLEPVNTHWARIAPNQIFGQQEPTRYFHFCNYAYILSRGGAKKILDAIGARGGYYTSADHMICNRVQDMKHYVLIPQVAGCYQDDDPKYANSEFNNYNRVDGFDSDLWNNDERFSTEEIHTCLAKADSHKIPIYEALQDAAFTAPSGRIFTVGAHKHTNCLMEYKWLENLFGPDASTVPCLPVDHTPLKTCPTFIYFKVNRDDYLSVFERYEQAGYAFNVIHISDEHLNDPVHFYGYTSCKRIVRAYLRPDVPCPEKVTVIPLGPHWFPMSGDSIHEKSLVWSFYGTGWMGRGAVLDMFRKLGPYECKIFDTWEDSMEKGLKQVDYSKLLAKSLFIPCMRGQNVETYRFWEALEHGCIPIYIRSAGDDMYYEYISKHLPIISLPTIDHALQFMESLLKNQPTLAQYRETLLKKWLEWKAELAKECRAILVA